MTSHPGIGQDVAVFFKNMSTGNLFGKYEELLVAPVNLKQSILRMIEGQIKKGSQGRIIMKMNSVTDIDYIKKIAEASKAGVKIDLIVRGICCILPGIEGETENLRVTSIVGRYLEHPRIFSFGSGNEQRLYIGSADMMTRNTEKRVEVSCPIYDKEIKARLNHILEVMLTDNVKARRLTSDGSYEKIAKDNQGVLIDSQQVFMNEALQAERTEAKPDKSTFIEKIKGLFLR